MLPKFNEKKLRQCNRRLVSSESEQKSFHFDKNASSSNFYLKKVKHTSFAFRSKQNNPFINFKKPTFNNSNINVRRSDSLTKNMTCILNLERNKSNMVRNMNETLHQVGKSFNRYIEGQNSHQTFKKYQRKKILSCKNILKQLKNMAQEKNNFLPQVTTHQKNLLQITAEINYQAYLLENSCIDSVFAYNRYGPSMQTHNNDLILYGGSNSNTKKSAQLSCFHRYKVQSKSWTKVQQPNPCLSITTCFHTIDIYRHFMILVGGSSVSEDFHRVYNDDICIFNFDKKEWSKLKGSIKIRSHASTMYGNTLMIHGGIDERQKTTKMMHFIKINQGNELSSTILSTKSKIDRDEDSMALSLAHHKIVNSYQVDSVFKNLLKYDGVFCFGGENANAQMHNEIYFLNCIRDNTIEITSQKWIKIECQTQKKPVARKNHTLTTLNKKALILLVGGDDYLGRILNDIWTFDLVKLEWRQIIINQKVGGSLLKMQPQINCINEGVSGHCASLIGSKVYIFGGKRCTIDKKSNGLWFIETDTTQWHSRKGRYEKSINFSTVNTLNNQIKSSLSMWNIDF